MHGIGNPVSSLDNARALRTDVMVADKATKAQMAQNITRQVAIARPSLKGEAEKIANKVIEGNVETLDWQNTVVDLDSSGSYIDLSAEANFIYPWEGGTASNNAKAGQWDIIQWCGIYHNQDIQAATLAEICESGKVEIHWGDSDIPTRVVPLVSFLVNRYDLVVGGTNTAAGIQHGIGFSFDSHRPLIVVPSDTNPKLKITGLSGTIAGSSPNLTLQTRFRGLRVRT